MLGLEQQRELLRLARCSIRAAAQQDEHISQDIECDYPSGYGAFVSLHKAGHELRGCIGCLTSAIPLFQVVEKMAKSAALSDPRFAPVQPEEIAGITIEISVLSPPVVVSNESQLQIGLHGLVIELGNKRGVLLPQVATSFGWDIPTFIAQTCHKANVSLADYHAGHAKLLCFSAQVFSESSV
ncbi:MAG: AmmeMemoRadiSam system protein A [Myxococcota bacterium]|nr:AmmeMemoRadiSam system protein A [Myxococcota bacterium]